MTGTLAAVARDCAVKTGGVLPTTTSAMNDDRIADFIGFSGAYPPAPPSDPHASARSNARLRGACHEAHEETKNTKKKRPLRRWFRQCGSTVIDARRPVVTAQ